MMSSNPVNENPDRDDCNCPECQGVCHKQESKSLESYSVPVGIAISIVGFAFFFHITLFKIGDALSRYKRLMIASNEFGKYMEGLMAQMQFEKEEKTP